MSSDTSESHLKHFWNLVTFRRYPETSGDLHMMVQVEMMKYNTSAIVCKLAASDYEKCMTSLFVGEPDYFCAKSKYLIKNSRIRDLIDIIRDTELVWQVKTNLEGLSYIEVSWNHW
jgi:hypothetical protein